jgi:hypothetical protein
MKPAGDILQFFSRLHLSILVLGRRLQNQFHFLLQAVFYNQNHNILHKLVGADLLVFKPQSWHSNVPAVYLSIGKNTNS